MPPDAYADAGKRERHALEVFAAVRELRKPAAVSHVSAAVLHGLPLWNVPLDRVHLTRDQQGGGCGNKRRILHALPLPKEHTVTIGGVTVTSLARTITDIGAMELFEQAVIMGDAALNAAMLTVPDLAEATADLGNRPGARRSVAAFDAMDLRSESPGETRCRLMLIRLGIPFTHAQRVVRHNGEFIARVDFADDEDGIIIEFDGMLKYQLDGVAPEDVSQVLAQEKRREERLTNLGLKVVRVVWKDLTQPDVVLASHRNALTLARKTPRPLWDAPDESDVYRPRHRPFDPTVPWLRAGPGTAAAG